MILILKYNIGSCYDGVEIVSPVKYPSKEQFLEDFEKYCKSYIGVHYDGNGFFVNDDLRPALFIKSQMYFPPEVWELDEWIEQECLYTSKTVETQ